ncbi:MAG: nucleotidyltransferase domain-containing protein [Candidatus Aenigmarchaeota archaeon]|nr:nucleotidyltransferase domain-containing protein [Candidatus Aenigmarchaeota archaeon]
MKKHLGEVLDKAKMGKVKKDNDIVAVSVFGSFARNEKYRDIDVCLFLKPGMSRGKMSKKRLAYMAALGGKLDIHIFQQMPLPLKHRILKEGKVIYCSDEGAFYDMAYLTAKEFEDFKHIYKGYLEAVKYA